MRKLNIILVDDDPLSSKSVRLLLEDLGHEIKIYSDPLEVLQAVPVADLLISDQDFPGTGVSGIFLIHAFKTAKLVEKTILLTGWDSVHVPNWLEQPDEKINKIDWAQMHIAVLERLFPDFELRNQSS